MKVQFSQSVCLCINKLNKSFCSEDPVILMNKNRTIFFIALQMLFSFAIGQEQRIRFEHHETSNGLSQSNVSCILQDSRGFMWFGTRDGLNRYDGYKFTVYRNDPRNPHSLSNNFIRGIAESRNGDLWIATLGGGLCRYD